MKQEAFRVFRGVEIKSSHHENWRARIALSIIEKHALVTGIPDGEDSSGRQKGRLPTAEELVTRSCDIADRLVNEFESRGWMLEIKEQEIKEQK